MADEFVKLAKSSETNIDSYLAALDRYLLSRYIETKKQQGLLEKIRNNLGTSWDFIQLYEKAKKNSEKNNTHITLEYIDLLATTKNIGDDWINNKDTRKAVEMVRTTVILKMKHEKNRILDIRPALENIINGNLKNMEIQAVKLNITDKMPLADKIKYINDNHQARKDFYSVIIAEIKRLENRK